MGEVEALVMYCQSLSAGLSPGAGGGVGVPGVWLCSTEDTSATDKILF